MRIYCDGSFLSYRSQSPFFQQLGYKPRHSSGWVATGTLYSVLRDFLKLREKFKNDDVKEWAVVWDKKPTVRLEVDSNYKAHRHTDMTEDEYKNYQAMKRQMIELKAVLKILGINQYYSKGYEADDVLATLAKSYGDDGVCLVTSDKDLYQTITPNVFMYNFKMDKNYNWFKEQYNIEPITWIDVQTLTGDDIDNIKGVRGVGEKTALKLLKAYKTPEKSIENLKVDYEKVLKQIEISKQLVTLHNDVDLEVLNGEFDRISFRRFLILKKMKKFLNKIDDFGDFEIER